MKKIWFGLVLVLAGTLFVCHGQENQGRRSVQRGRSVRPMSESDAGSWKEVQEKLRKFDAKEYGEIEKLAASNLAAAFNKMLLLAEKAKINTPAASISRSRRPMMRGGMNGGRPGMGGMMGRGGFRGAGMGRGGMFMNPSARNEAEKAIQAKFPAEFAAYEKKQEETRSFLKELAGKAKVSLPADMSDLAYIRKKYASELNGLDFRASFEKLRSLVEKEGYTMGNGGSSGRFGRGGMEGGEASSALPPPPPKRDLARAQLARKVRDRFPAQWKEYVTLRKTDKAAAEKKLEELLKLVK